MAQLVLPPAVDAALLSPAPPAWVGSLAGEDGRCGSLPPRLPSEPPGWSGRRGRRRRPLRSPKGAAGKSSARSGRLPPSQEQPPRSRGLCHACGQPDINTLRPQVAGSARTGGGGPSSPGAEPLPGAAAALGQPPPSARPLPVIARLRFLRSSPQTRRDRKEAAWNGGAPGPLLPRWRLPLRPDPPGWAPGSPAAFHAPDADGRGGPARRARERPRKLPLPTARTPRQAEPGPPRPPAVRATRRAAGRTSAAKPVSPSATSSTPRGTPPADPPERPAGRAAGQRPPRNKRSHPDASFLLYCAPGENCFCRPPPALPTATPARPPN
ncbi:basic proline-rich protein-like [Crotalus tigris]|uniref:basic proline-rich protein-like n=1 Tax=Crotalus tigris TaxID=88082 RepID=UPI00192F17D0|nr:basic proline-rich protein-like [Crotalus tigris]